MADDVDTGGDHQHEAPNAERMQRLQELFGEALEQEPEQRESFLAEACRDDQGVLADVKARLTHQPLAERDNRCLTACRWPRKERLGFGDENHLDDENARGSD